MDNRNTNSFVSIFNAWQIVTSLVSAILSSAVVIYGYKVGEEGAKSLWVAGVGVISTILVLFCGCLIAVKVMSAINEVKRKEELVRKDIEGKKDLAEARLKAEKAMAFDYKMYAPITSKSVLALLQNYGWDLDKMHNSDVKLIEAREPNYISLEKLLDNKTMYGTDFLCLPVRSDEKWGKCIIQVSFIPIDEGGNIPLILRMPNAHSRDAVIHGQNSYEAKFTFVSFSPVPICYETSFDFARCYNREVPNRVARSEFDFEEVGCTMKFESDHSERRIYLFYVVKVRYKNVRFIDDKNLLNIEEVNRLFALNPGSKPEEIKYFRKDHDVIIAAAKPEDIYNALSKDGNKESLPEYLKRLFENSDFVVKSKQRDLDTNTDVIFEDHFDLSNGSLGKVELAHIQRMRV